MRAHLCCEAVAVVSPILPVSWSQIAPQVYAPPAQLVVGAACAHRHLLVRVVFRPRQVSEGAAMEPALHRHAVERLEALVPFS